MKKFIVAITALLCFSVNAQNNYTGYHSNAFLLQAGSNPAVMPQANVVFGVPGFSNGAFGMELPFTLNQIFESDENDSLRASLPVLVSNLKDQNVLSFSTKDQLFYLGAKLGSKKKIFAYVGSDLVADVALQFSDDFIGYLSNGNANYLNQQVNLTDERFESIIYNSFYIGAAYDLNDKLNVGGRLNFLTGIANVHTDKMNIGLFTDSTSMPLYATTLTTDMLIQTSGMGAASDSIDFDPMLNSGFSFDIGATYQYNEKLGLSFAVNDIGSITWDETNNEYYTTDGEVSFVFDGLTQTSSGAENLQEQMEEILDSLTTTLEPSKTTGTYSTKLNSNLYLGANYKLTDKHQFSFLYHNTKRLGAGYNAISLGYQFNLAKSLQLLASYQNANGMNNVGAGFVWSPGPLQMHMILDNIRSFDVFDAENLYLQFGLSLHFGRNKKVE